MAVRRANHYTKQVVFNIYLLFNIYLFNMNLFTLYFFTFYYLFTLYFLTLYFFIYLLIVTQEFKQLKKQD